MVTECVVKQTRKNQTLNSSHSLSAYCFYIFGSCTLPLCDTGLNLRLCTNLCHWPSCVFAVDLRVLCMDAVWPGVTLTVRIR